VPPIELDDGRSEVDSGQEIDSTLVIRVAMARSAMGESGWRHEAASRRIVGGVSASETNVFQLVQLGDKI
jgi:hypothetical protein